MNLEKMIAEYIDLGITSYPETFKFQEELAKKRARDEIPDTILITEHYPIVNFGMGPTSHNCFSDELSKEMEDKGIKFTEENAIEYLKEKGVEFCRTSRGGGATFIGPGQINFYPIVKYEKIAKTLMGINKYKKIIDSIMYSALRSYGLDVRINEKNLDSGQAKQPDRKDIWIEESPKKRTPSLSLSGDSQEDGKYVKLGGKGIRTSGSVAYHGFNFYVKDGSTKGFDYVNPCGYTRDELGTISVEEAMERKVPKDDFIERVLGEIKEKFGYDELREGSRDEIKY